MNFPYIPQHQICSLYNGMNDPLNVQTDPVIPPLKTLVPPLTQNKIQGPYTLIPKHLQGPT